MQATEQAGRRAVIVGSVVALLLAATLQCAAALPLADDVGIQLQMTSAPTSSFDHYLHRLVTRTEHSVRRASHLVGIAGMVWLWILVSAVVFLFVTAVSSGADFRMLAWRGRGAGARLRYLGYGSLTFLRILRDRRTPTIARGVLVVGLLYWLLPIDLIPDRTLVPGFIDDLLIAVSAAKAFIYLCPDSLVATHAAAVEAHAA